MTTEPPTFSVGDIVELSPLAYEELPELDAWTQGTVQRTGEVMQSPTQHGNVRVQWWHLSACYAPRHLQHVTTRTGEVLTAAMLNELVGQAERGYAINQLRVRAR